MAPRPGVWLRAFSLAGWSAILVGVALGAGAPGRAPDAHQGQRCGARLTMPCLVRGDFVSLSAGFLHTCGLTRDGMAFCWGDGRSGALGNGKMGVRTTPTRVDGKIRFVEVRSGGNFSCGRSADSAVYFWGKSQPVPGYPKAAAVPAQVKLDGRAMALAAGRRHSCVIVGDGTASCWGFNVDGEGGNGTSGIAASVTLAPTPVAGALRFSAITAGLDFTCALTVAGEPYCWGSNVDGVMGDSASERCGDVAPVPCSSRPVRVETMLTFVEIAAGAGHVCARTARAEVFCWGSNAQGQIGSPGREEQGRVFPPRHVSVPGETPVSGISVGASHSCALTTNGALFCWGSDAAGQLGSGRNLEVERTPLRSQWRLTFQALSAGGYHTCGLTLDGDVFCWGDNQFGALGSS